MWIELIYVEPLEPVLENFGKKCPKGGHALHSTPTPGQVPMDFVKLGKTMENGIGFSSQGNIEEFYNSVKYQGIIGIFWIKTIKLKNIGK